VRKRFLLDVNEMAKNESFMALGTMVVSDDGNLLAYSCDNRGFRQYKLYVKDLRSGELLSQQVDRVGSVVWAADNRTLLYTVEDEEQKRPVPVLPAMCWALRMRKTNWFTRRRTSGSTSARGARADDRYIILESASHTTTEERFLPANEPRGEWRLVEQAARRDPSTNADHRNGAGFISRVKR